MAGDPNRPRDQIGAVLLDGTSRAAAASGIPARRGQPRVNANGPARTDPGPSAGSTASADISELTIEHLIFPVYHPTHLVFFRLAFAHDIVPGCQIVHLD